MLFRIFDRTLYGPRKQRKGESKRRRRRNLNGLLRKKKE